MDKRKITSLTRPLDLSDKGNLLIVLITAIIFLTSTAHHYIFTGKITIAFFAGIEVSLIIFLTWAISRELDPDHAFSAFVPVIFVLIIILLFGANSILPMLWIIMILRTINRTTGSMASIPDILIILFLGILLTFQVSWIYGMLTGLGLIADSRLPLPIRHGFIAGIIIVIVSLLTLISEDMTLSALSLSDYPILIAISILFLPVMIGSSELQSMGDRTGEPLDPARVRTAQLMVLVIIFSLNIGGVNGWLYVMYCILAGIGVYWIFSGRVIVA
ncbi:hypothetical protein V7O62_11100 [Methanolobus sp. ZRKC2]|uniref:hypothetical protein n=1 Tax=Methanolobus sp. ZRKC2 TaxID=3125783 RepID=UPI0032520C3C